MRWIFWTQWQCIVHHQVRRIWHQGQLLEHVFKPFKVTGALFLFLCMTTKSRPKEVCSWRQVAVRFIVTRSIDVSCGQSDQKRIVLQSARFSLTWRCSWSHVWAHIWIFEELSYQFSLNLKNRLVCDEFSCWSCKDRGAAWSWIRSRPIRAEPWSWPACHWTVHPYCCWQ